MAAAITLEDMQRHLGTTQTDPSLPDTIRAVVNLVEDWKAKPLAQWPERWRLGCMMLIARVDRRRMSPSGVDTVTEMGPVYMSRKDPEVAQLLEIGAYSRLEVG